ncbi:MAG: ester cyclase [Bryobacteraceae bacterium]
MASRNVETCKAAHLAFNRRDFDAVLNAMAEDVTYHDRARDVTFRGRTGFREFMQEWVTAFSNCEVSEPIYIDAGDTVVSQFVGTGVNDGPLGPLPPTGKPLIFHLCESFRFNDQGQIVSGAIYYDQLSIMIQLGHAQAPQKTATA